MPALQATTGEARLTLGRCRVTTRVPRNGIGATAVNAGAFFSDYVTPALKEALTPLMESGDPSVWIIRKLDVKFLSDASTDHRDIGRAFALSFRQAMVRAFKGEGNAAAIRFPDRAAYLAQFLVDLADGRAWDRWYYGHLASLRPLPLGAAAGILLERERPYALSALVKIDESGRLRTFVQKLGEEGARRIYRNIVPLAAVEEAMEASVVAVAELLLREPGLLAYGAGDRLRLCLLTAMAARSGVAVDSAAAAIETVFAMLSAAQSHAFGARDALPDAVSAPASGAHRPGTLTKQIDVLERLISKTTADGVTRRQRAASASPMLVTPYAGVFLLWRSALALALDRLVAEGMDTAKASVRLLVLAAKLAGPSWRGALHDRAVQWLAGIEEPPGDAEIAATMAFSEAEHDAVGRRLLATLLERRPLSPLALLLQHENGVSVLQDADRQDWLAADRASAPSADLSGIDVGWLLLRDGIAIDCIPAQYRAWPCEVLADSDFALLAPAPAARDGRTIAHARRIIEAVRPVGGDLDYFDVGGAEIDPRSALLWAVLARAAYGDLARRLPGLELSSASYLGRNVVEGTGRFDRATGDCDAEIVLPPAPMDLVLRMTGLDGTVLRLGDGRSLRIRLPGD